jgi:hypothetical protein
MKEIKFVCCFGKQRSPTASDRFNHLLEEEGLKDFYKADFLSIRQTKRNKKGVERAYKVVALDPVARGILFRNFPDLIGSKRFEYFPLPRLRRRNSEDLIKKIEEYYYSERWA